MPPMQSCYLNKLYEIRRLLIDDRVNLTHDMTYTGNALPFTYRTQASPWVKFPTKVGMIFQVPFS